MRTVVRLSILSLIASLFAGAADAAPAPSPRLVVVLVVDQMRGDYIDRFGFQWTGGLRQAVRLVGP